MLEREIGHDTLLQEALDRLIPEVYREAIEQEDIDAIELPQVEMVSTDPLVMKATVPIRPTVELGDYHGMWLPREPVVVAEERVDEALEQLRHRYANLEPVTRAADWGDVVTADVRGSVDGRALFDRSDVEFQLRKDRPVFVPGLAEEIVGLGKGAEKEVDLPLPGDFPESELAGKACHCRVAVHEVKEEQLPAAGRRLRAPGRRGVRRHRRPATAPDARTCARRRKKRSSTATRTRYWRRWRRAPRLNTRRCSSRRRSTIC